MKKTIITSAVLAAGISASSAGVIAHYGLESVYTADSVTAGITASDIASKVTGGFSTTQPIESATSRYLLNSQITNDTGVAVANIIETFTLTPDSGQSITLDATDSITMQMRAFSGLASGFIMNTRIYVSDTSDFSNILASSATFTAEADGAGVYSPIVDVNLDSAVESSGPLYIGLAFTDNSTSGNKNGRYDAVYVNGTISAVPEPSSAALLGLGGLSLILRRRK